MLSILNSSDFDDAVFEARALNKALYLCELDKFGFDHQELADAPMDPDNAYVRWLRERWGRKEVDAAFGHGVDPNGWVGKPGHLPEEQTMTWWCMERAIDFLKNTCDPTSPFFLRRIPTVTFEAHRLSGP